MSKLPRTYQKIFAALAPLEDMGIFGSEAAGLPSNSLDLFDIQDTSNFDAGWASAILGENAPALEDLNALFFLLFSQMAYQFQAGIPEWDSRTPYYINSMVNSGGIIYISKTDNNINNAVIDSTNWGTMDGSIRPTVGTDSITTADRMIEANATTGSFVETLPVASTCKGRKFTITKMDATTNTVQVTDGTYSRYLTGQYDSVTVFSNGTVFYEIA